MGLRSSKGPNVIVQEQHLDSARAQKVLGDVLVPGDVITDDPSSAGRLVGEGNLIRVIVAAQTWVAFGEVSIGAVSVATTPAVELPSAGTYLISCTADYVRMSSAPSRLERISAK